MLLSNAAEIPVFTHATKRPELIRVDGHAVRFSEHCGTSFGHEIFRVAQHPVHVEDDAGKTHEVPLRLLR